MQIQEVVGILENWAPTAYAESFDNVGLLIGNPNTVVSGVLVTLDTLETVIEEAIEKNCNLIVSFHPIIFDGLKKFNGANYVQRVVQKAIKNDIAIHAIHTALDNVFHGVSDSMCEQLGLTGRRILIPQKGTIKKMVTYAPVQEASALRKALFAQGAGTIGNYKECSFSTAGTGTFNATESANPSVGTIGTLQVQNEEQISITFPKHLEQTILTTLFEQHSYEEVAYEITTLDNTNQQIGMGMIGELPEAMEERAFLQLVKKKFHSDGIRHSVFRNKPIKKVAVLGGSGSFAIGEAKKQKADAFITADLKYHQFYEAENTLLLADIGHYESEQFTKNLIVSYLRKKISNFAIILSDRNTNPVKYL